MRLESENDLTGTTERIGLTAADLEFTGNAADGFTNNVILKSPLPTFAALDGALLQLRAVATVQCAIDANGAFAEDPPAIGAKAVNVTIDNKPPSGTVSFSFDTTNGNYLVGLASPDPSPLASSSVDVSSLGPIPARVPGPTTNGGSTSHVVPATTRPGSASLWLNDSVMNGVNVTGLARLDNFQAFALTGGIVRVEFTGDIGTTDPYVFAYKPTTLGATWSMLDAAPSANSIRAVRLDAGTTTSVKYNIEGLTSGTTYEIRAMRVAGGNHGVPSDLKTVTPAAAPNSLIFDTMPATPGAPAIGTIAGRWIGPQKPVVYVSLRDPTGTLYWQDDSGNTFANATVKKFTATVNDDGTWTTPKFTAAATPAIATLAEARYRVYAEFLSLSSGIHDPVVFHEFILDRTAPALQSKTPAANVFTPAFTSTTQLQQNVTRPTFYSAIEESETGSGFDRLVFTLQKTTTGNPTATDIFGNPVVITCTLTSAAPPCTKMNHTALGAKLDMNHSLTPPPVPLGSDYRFQVVAFDKAQNSVTVLTTGAFTVGARLTLVGAPVIESGVKVYDQPSMDSANRLKFSVFAAFNGTTAFNPAGACASSTCRVTGLEIHGRNRSATGTTLLANLPIPARGPDDFLASAGDSFLYYDHSPTNPVEIGSFDPPFLDIRATARVQISSTATVSIESPWIRVLPVGATSGVSVNQPVNNATVYLDNAGGKMLFNVSYENGALTAPPILSYKVWQNGTSGTYLDLADGSTETSAFSTTVTAINRAPFYYFNWTNGGAVPRGEYVLNVTLATSTGDPITGTFGSRFFGVETDPVAVAFDFVASQIYPPPPGLSRYVRSPFDVNLTVTHGFQNLTGASGVVACARPGPTNQQTFSTEVCPRLVAPNLEGAGTRTVTVGNEGFDIAFREIVRLDETRSRVWLNVTLPSNASDGNRYDLRFNVSTDSWNRMNLDRANGSAITTIIVDAAAPSSGVLQSETNSTGIGSSSPLVLHGFAVDAGGGVTDVQVRIFNVTGNSTFVPATSLFEAGFRDAWLSSATPVGTGRVELTGPFGTQWFWQVRAATGVAFDRNSTYTIDVRAKDAINPIGVANTFTVGFDRVRPNVTTRLNQLPSPAQSTPAGFPTTFVGWHGSTIFNATVQDNNCIRRVSLWSTMPSGAVHGPFNMTYTATTGFPERLCGPTAAPRAPATDALENWSVDLGTYPLSTEEVGRVEYRLEVEDSAGLLFNDTRTTNLTVNDTSPADVRFLYLEPPVVQTGAGSRVIAEVTDNYGVANVTAFFYRRLSDGTLVELARGNLTAQPGNHDPATGIGNWTVSTEEMGLSALESGDYVWLIRPVDKSTEVSCPDGCLVPGKAIICEPGCASLSIAVLVRADVGVQIQQDFPIAGTTFVNATPTFRWKVFDRTITASGITLSMGATSTSLATVTPTSVTDMPLSGGQRTGLFVEHRPNLSGQTSVSIRLEATSGGSTNRTDVATYAVDAVAPVVSHSVSGTINIGGKEWTTLNTRVTLNATDERPVTTTYTVNDGNRLTYATTPITPSGPQGPWRLDYQATDAASNTARGTVTLSIDTLPPTISVNKHGHGGEVIVTVSDGDEGVGVNDSEVRIHYSYDLANSTYTTVTMAKVTGNTYRVQLTGNASATGLKYYFDAKDLLGNQGTSNYTAARPYEIPPEGGPENLPPTLQVTSPTTNMVVRSKVELRWLATDPEGADLTMVIALRGPSGEGRIVERAGENNGTWTIDLAGEAEGTYTLIVTASDGDESAQEEVTFVIQRGELIEVVTPPPATSEVNKPVAFSVRVPASDKPIAAASYTLLRDNQSVSTGVMRGGQGTYSASIIPTEAGKYAIMVSLAYADGSTEPARQVAQFDVTGTGPVTPPPDGGLAFPPSLITLVVLALVTVGLAAYVAFVRWPR